MAEFEAAKIGHQPPEGKQYHQPEMRLLVALCYRLATTRKGSFFLSSRGIAGLFGLADHMQAWRWLRRLEGDGVIVRAKSGSMASRKANEYVWGADL